MSHAETDAVVQQHRAAVDSYARLCCPGPEAAADLVTEALASAGRSSLYYGERPETAWRPFLLAEVRRTAADWAAGHRAAALAPDFRLWYEQLTASFGPVETMRRAEEASLVLQAFNALPDRARHTLWHQVVEGEPGPDDEAVAAVDALRDSCLRRLTDRAPGPDCHHYSRMLGAVVRGTNQRTSEDLEQHLAICPSCSAGYRDLQLITRAEGGRSGALAARLLMWGHRAYLTECARLRSALPVPIGPQDDADVSGQGRDEPRRRRFPAGAVAVVAVLATAAVAGVAAAIVPALSDDRAADGAGSTAVATTGRSAASRSAPAAPAGVTPAESPSTVTADTTITLVSSATKRCLEITGGSGVLGAIPVQAGCDSSAVQQWKVLDVEGDAVKLRNAASSLCLDIGRTPKKGTAVVQRPCAIGEQSQMWLLKVYPRAGYTVVVCKSDTGLRLGLGSRAKDSAVVLVRAKDGTTGRFKVDDALK